MTRSTAFVAFLEDRGLAHDETTLGRYMRFLELLLETNETTNLTAVRDFDASVSRHLEDSLELVTELRALGAHRVVDLGTGGGLPGIPLAIALPELRFKLVDAREKKVAFVARAAATLGLSNVETSSARAETLGHPSSHDREAHDVVVSRALAPLPVLVELASPLVRVGGALVCVKGERYADELAEAHRACELLGLVPESSRRTATSTIGVLRKMRPTPPRFPRAPGEPKRKPL